MQFDLPLILVSLVAVTGAVWLFDIVVLRPRRAAAVAAWRSANKVGDDAEVPRQVAPEPVVVEYAIAFFPVLLLVLVLRSFLFEPYQIPSGSMIPTLKVGDFILVNKYSYGIRLPVLGTKVVEIGDPRPGDVMVFVPPHQNRYFIKRVIGVPGDLIRYENKVLYVNGEAVRQELVAQSPPPPQSPLYRVYEEAFGDGDDGDDDRYRIQKNMFDERRVQEWRVPEGHYFMMGDNRDRSDDSRRWGFVPDENIVGRAVVIWMHKEPGFHLPEFSRNGAIR